MSLCFPWTVSCLGTVDLVGLLFSAVFCYLISKGITVNLLQEYQRQRQEQKRSNGCLGKQHIPIDDNDDDSDSGSDSPKHWQKNPLCVKRTKKRSNGRPASGEVGIFHASDPTALLVDDLNSRRQRAVYSHLQFL